MNSYICEHCDYIYDLKLGDIESEINPGKLFEEISEAWICHLCGVNKDMFKKN